MKTQYAFSLIELMMAVAILAILMTVVLPDMRYALINNRITTRANEFISAFHLARSEAVTYNKPVQIIPIDDDWNKGWKIWSDDNKDNVEDPLEVIKSFEYAQQNILITPPTGVTAVVYTPPRGSITASAPLIFTICLENRQSYEPLGREIRIENETGRVSMSNRNYPCPTAS